MCQNGTNFEELEIVTRQYQAAGRLLAASLGEWERRLRGFGEDDLGELLAEAQTGLERASLALERLRSEAAARAQEETFHVHLPGEEGHVHEHPHAHHDGGHTHVHADGTAHEHPHPHGHEVAGG
ncbi:MAG: hypothetical protein QJR14_09310 [Bacillota bacterium]|nr:hypothetical protein [Bacillota bacterium]